jgi:hypothetical protein
MNIENKELSAAQMTAMRRVMDKYQDVLSALAGNPVSSELQEKIDAAKVRMEKYRTTAGGSGR